MSRNPNVTIWDGSTEAPDETARGDWMKLVADAGLQWDKAILDYLVQGHHEIERKVEPFWNGVSLTINRPRPPKPLKTDEKKTTTQDVQVGHEGRARIQAVHENRHQLRHGRVVRRLHRSGTTPASCDQSRRRTSQPDFTPAIRPSFAPPSGLPKRMASRSARIRAFLISSASDGAS